MPSMKSTSSVKPVALKCPSRMNHFQILCIITGITCNNRPFLGISSSFPVAMRSPISLFLGNREAGYSCGGGHHNTWSSENPRGFDLSPGSTTPLIFNFPILRVILFNSERRTWLKTLFTIEGVIWDIGITPSMQLLLRFRLLALWLLLINLLKTNLKTILFTATGSSQKISFQPLFVALWPLSPGFRTWE